MSVSKQLAAAARHLLSLAVLLILSACGGPTSPDGGSAQSVVNNMTPDIKVNGVTLQPGSTTNVTVGTMVGFLVNYTNNSGQTLHTAVAAVRDDGVERIEQCGATGSGGDGGGFGAGKTIFSNDPVYTPGHTVRLMLFAALGPGPTGPGQCLLLLGSFPDAQLNHAAVQAERLLATFAVQ
jgi:hypothetical protein